MRAGAFERLIGGTRLRDCLTTFTAATLLALYWWLAVSASLEKSHTSDELPHIAAGFAFDRFGDFRMQPENGVLPQRLFGLSALAASAHMPFDDELWQHSRYWQIGWDFFYTNNNPTNSIVLGARALNALFGVALGGLIYAIARSWHGHVGGLIALCFYALSPQFLAHGALATSDLAVAFFLTLAPWLFWRHLEKRDVSSGLLAAVATGFTLVAKFNGLLLAPTYVLLALADVLLRDTEEGRSRAARLSMNCLLGLAQAAAATGIIWAYFNFRFEARGPGTPPLLSFAWEWEPLLNLLGWKRVIVERLLDWKLLPEAWLHGLTNVLAGEGGRPAFFAGEHSLHGWWQFFPTLVLVKTPVALLAALVIALGAGTRAFVRADAPSRVAWLRRVCPLVVVAALVWFTAITSRINIGDRHILAMFPILFIATGSLASLPGAMAVICVPLLVVAHAWSSFAIRPHYLAFFNVIAGGPQNAYRLVADSSLDWGQDLPTLSTWLAQHRQRGEPIYLGYFGSAWPPHYGVRPDHFLPASGNLARPPLQAYDFSPGLYCLSATILDEVYSPHRGPWTARHENEYRRLRAIGSSASISDFATYDELRLSRLCKYLQTRTPYANAGYSILIFRLTAKELRDALEEPITGTHRLRMP